MRFVRSLRTFSTLADFQNRISSGAVVGVTIGNFDGMHIGHQELFTTLGFELDALCGRGEANAVKILLTFEPHPRRVFGHIRREDLYDRSEFWTLNSVRQKVELARNFGFDYFYAIRFSHQFASTKPDEFVSRYLRSFLHARLVVVGHDWSFGQDRAGSVELLSTLGEDYGFKVCVVPPVFHDGKRVSSGVVKEALRSGDLTKVLELLGRNFSISGKVTSGCSRGKEIGYPTANLRFSTQILPRDGVYASYAYCEGVKIPSVTNVGIRPTFGPSERLVETHFLDGRDYNLSAERLTVEFVKRLRDESKFSSTAELRDAIKRDVKIARSIVF